MSKRFLEILKTSILRLGKSNKSKEKFVPNYIAVKLHNVKNRQKSLKISQTENIDYLQRNKI